MSSSLLDESPFPPILSAVQQLPPAGHLELSRSDLIATHTAPVSTTAGLVEAFHFVLILHLLVSEAKSASSSAPRNENTLDVWHGTQQRIRRKDHLDHLAIELLESIPRVMEDEGNVHIEDILCAAFPFDASRTRMIRAIDLLPLPGVPSDVLQHPLITLTISKLWKYGKVHANSRARNLSYFKRYLARYDSCATPRVEHTVHLVFHLAYLGLLAHLILYPAPLPLLLHAPGGPIGIREPLITIYCITNILFRPLSLLSVPHILALVSFLLSLPASPSPEALPYTILLLAFGLHIFLLHLPTTPTPILLVQPDYSLPLSSLYYTLFSRYLLPTFIYFLPVISISAVLLSLSLAEPSSRGSQIMEALAAPSAARITFMALLVLFLFLAILISAFVLLRAPYTTDDTCHGYWEIYGADAGVWARRALIRAINSYSSSPSDSISFPPPLNVLSLPLVVLPQATRKAVWRIIVGPMAFIIALLWCWS